MGVRRGDTALRDELDAILEGGAGHRRDPRRVLGAAHRSPRGSTP
jgi:hypothetical protein